MNEKEGRKPVFPRPLVKQVMVFILAALCCGSAATAMLPAKPSDTKPMKTTRNRLVGMPVSIRSVEPGSYRAVVTALGEVVPLFQTTIKSQVEGPVLFLSRRLQPGNRVERGEVLLRIAKSRFEMHAAEARSRLSAARVRLLREEREAREARKNWTRSGIRGEPKSPLVLREPQLTAAREEVKSARAALVHAETQLGYTEIAAPFDAVVLERSVNPGETLFAGDTVAVLYGMDTAECGVHLDAAQWALLPATLQDTKVRLIDPRTEAVWEARVVRESLFLNRDSRLRTLFLRVKQPLGQAPPLLPGTFVRAEMKGRETAGLLRIPETALTKQGFVWFVDKENRLQSHRTEPVFYGEAVVYIPVPGAVNRTVRVAVSPHSGFTRGLVVRPIQEKEGC
jgi:RND family efflux transporter MFP subunit